VNIELTREFIEFLRPESILMRQDTTDRRRARRHARHTGIRFRVVRRRPRLYRFPPIRLEARIVPQEIAREPGRSPE